MARFFVGQRVKVVRRPAAPLRPHLGSIGAKLGDEGHVLGTGSRPNRGFWSDGEEMLSVKLDLYAEHGMAPAYCFEPIQPKGERAGVKGTCEPLDKLLSEVRHREAVK